MTPDEFQLHVIESLAKLDTHMVHLVGNGQPGRIRLIEEDLEALKKARWTLGGMIVGITTAVSAAIHFLFKY
jgi:hypothetical protein